MSDGLSEIAFDEDATPDCHEGSLGANIAGRVRLAYADPPYPGQSARYYAEHPDFAGEVDHAELIERLGEYDGWALSTSMVALRDVLALCPPEALVASWWNTAAAPPGYRTWTWWYSWEPLIVKPARRRPTVRNVLACSYRNFYSRGGDTFVGQKPRQFCEWMFDLLGAVAGDSFDDLFPGSGAVSEAWSAWSAQGRLVA